ncbi:hypothetical protein QQ73_09955, partial [Candidatus Endoriftia persephone str. Guaymas]|nr:hypothetical protein [Candidatus Endoriftia persephone str. Guaymas]
MDASLQLFDEDMPAHEGPVDLGIKFDHLNPPVYQQQPWQVDAGKCDYYDVCLARSAHYASWRRIIYML